ncbi:ATP-dependent DNA helicase PIF1-like [Hydra vulgaris]|uniref:ATP-dependent DNA helicase n=1 Tax=Hydra vulgaris TaxID=6087 RepID=A0ABM4CLT7_HYDVU
MDVFYEGEIVKNKDGSFGIVNDKIVNIDLAPLLFELAGSDIYNNVRNDLEKWGCLEDFNRKEMSQEMSQEEFDDFVKEVRQIKPEEFRVISYSEEKTLASEKKILLQCLSAIAFSGYGLTQHDSEIFEKMNKIRENDNKKMLKLLCKQNLLTEDEIVAVKFLLLIHGPDDISSLQWLDDGINFFITGGAGCGKSYIVKEIAQSIQIYKTIHITASTGKAAHLLNGVTIHAFAGIETGVKSLDYYKRHMHPDIKKTWLETDALIIDEISMINAQTIDLLHLNACEMKQCYDELFDGIQVIACGDFFQLPPVTGEFVFKSKIWQQFMKEVLVLTKCFRQKEDAQFFGAFNELRFGQVSDQTIDYFKTRCFEKDENLNTKYTILFFRNMEVDVYNNNKMETIKQGYWFYANDDIKNHNIQCSFQIPAAVYPKIGAIVLLVRNINVEEGLCNGTIGTVFLIENNAVWVNMNKKEVKIECVKEEILDCSHAVVGSRFGLPLKLAFSFTVHKAQGSTMNKAVVQFNSKAFINSLYYVSLSRVCNINDIFIIINNKIELRKIFKSITVDSDVLEFYKKYM